MENKQTYEQIERLIDDMKRMQQTLDQSSQVLQSLLLENRNLVIENTHLRERLEKAQLPMVDKTTEGLSNLEKLYNSGVHICHNFYGATRQEMCLLCESLLSHHQD